MEMVDGYPLRSGFRGDNWELEDCAAYARDHTATFEVPSHEEAALVKVGNLLRLHFVITDRGAAPDDGIPRAERMWVEVCREADAGIFRGHLTITPAFISSLEPGDIIEFMWKHVGQVYIERNDPRHPSGHN